jgi:hypothetical protein
MTFDQWINRPVYKAQVATSNMAKQLLNMPNGDIATSGNHPILHLRLAKPYRNAYSIALRKQVADAMRLKRKQA